MDDWKNKIDTVKSIYNKRVGARDIIIAENETLIKEKAKYELLVLRCAQVVELLSSVSAQAREKAKGQLETIVTTALQYVSEDNYEFRIEPLNGKKPGYEFYVVSTINGIESKQKPQDACGGGFVDIIATALRYAYLNAFSDPVIGNFMGLDEPGKMVSEMASVKFAEFVKHLGSSFNRQTILVTHNESLLNVADKMHIVDKINGASVVSQPQKNSIIVNTIDDIDLEDIDLC